jgi:amidase
MDYNAVGEGASVILPAFHEGGLVYVGDGHALQGDGEATGTGIETSMEVELEFSVVQRYRETRVATPRILTRDSMITVGSQPEFASPLDRGLQIATTEMINWLVGQWGAEPWEAHMIVGYAGKYDAVTVDGSVALRVPRALTSKPPRANP